MKVSKRQQLLVLVALCFASAHPFSIPQQQRPPRPTNHHANCRTASFKPNFLPGSCSPRRSPDLSAAFIDPTDLVHAKEALHSTVMTIVQEYGNLARQHPGLVLTPEVVESTKTDLLQAYGDLLVQHPSLLVAQEAVQTHTKNWLERYGDLLNQYPLTTKSITASILACVGDAIAQWRSGEKYDAKRGLAFFGFGALYTGAFQHVWFTYLQQHIADWGAQLGVWGPERVALPVDLVIDADEWWRYFDIVSSLENPPSPAALAAGKLLVNQFLVIPFFYMPLFLAMTGALAGMDWKASFARGQFLYATLLKRNWFFWLPTQFLQFLVIPTEFQIPFLSMASLVWTVILSSIGGGSVKSPQSIVVYDQEPDGEDFVVRVRQVRPGAANQVTDDVRWEDVVDAVPLMANVTGDPRTSFTTGGFAAGLLAAAADEGILGETVSAVLGSSGPDVGVAVVTALGAGMGLMAGYRAAASNGTDTSSAQELSFQEEDDYYQKPEETMESSWLSSSWREKNTSGKDVTTSRHEIKDDENQFGTFYKNNESNWRSSHCEMPHVQHS